MPLSETSPRKRRVGSADAVSAAPRSLDIGAFTLTPWSIVEEPGSASSMDENPPRTAKELLSFLPIGDAYACKVIPIGFKERIIADLSCPNPPFYTYDDGQLPEAEEEKWTTMTRLLENSRYNFEDNANEKAWVEVAGKMLNAALSLCGSGLKGMVAVYDVQDPSLITDGLPTVNNQRIPYKKVDLVLAMSPRNPSVSTTCAKLRKANPLVRISQFVDAFLSRLVIPVFIEVGEAGKDYLEASLQLGIVGSAGLSQLERLGRTLVPKWKEEPVMLPMLGWTVIGHDWKLHIICQLKFPGFEQSGTVVYGPYDSGGTGSHFHIFTLLRVITMVVKWMEDVYWPYFSEMVEGRVRD
ncbi:hypothetical protein GP486_000974 [Trichoglossum hirsutum]|uniref:PD-(D/E)XK nuclease-like domain-containing protein n=1 Tax=Trichoglossum hirsutum TaxID=265104 RepID=A0A9P8LHQ1_9PEZI|nr:hypothetical protein GP486_000974 [Trichoglossum hirsutum]